MTNKYCRINSFTTSGGNAATHVRLDVTKLFIKTNVIEPITITFNLNAITNGHGINGYSHIYPILATVEIRGCPNEDQIVTIPGLVGNWDTH